VPAESGLVRLQEEIEDQQDRIIALDAYVVAAASDGVFTAEEFAEYRARRNGVLVKQQEVCRDVGFMADALGLVKTLLHIGAITPWAARQARERSEDRLRLLETPPNIIPFPVSDRTA